MSRFFGFRWLKAVRASVNTPSKSGSAGKQLRRARYAPRLEILEDRTVPSTFAVVNLADHGPGSLRQAVLDANAHPGPDTIVFADDVHGTIGLTIGQLTITDDLKIAGPGENRLTVSGSDSSRVFEIGNGVTATITRLTIAHGKVVGDPGGGGILNDAHATLNLDHDTLSSNQAVGAVGLDEFGGGLLNLGHANITASTFTDNQVTGAGSFSAIGGSAGGAIDNFGGANLTVANSFFSNNRVVSGAGAGYFALGGAIESNSGLNGFDPTLATPSTAIITHSIFIGNLAQGGAQATGNAGAIMNEGLGARMTLTDSLINGNRSLGGEGGNNNAVAGGILNAGIMEINDCAITDNQAVGGINGTIALDPLSGGAFGGGIENNFMGELHITRSLIAGNLAQGGATATGPGSDAFGGGISNSPNAKMTVTNSAIVNNRAIAGHGGAGGTSVPAGFGIGGGIDSSGNSTATLVGCLIAGNLAQGSAGGAGNKGGVGVGGGLAIGSHVLYGSTDSSHLTVRDCIIAGNQARGGEGGTAASGGDGLGGGFAIFAGSSATVSGSWIQGNLALGGEGHGGANGGNGFGGGIYVASGANVNVTQSTVTHNRAKGGEGDDGGSDGLGIGGGVYSLGAFTFDGSTVIKKNHASTSNDDIFP